MVPLGFHCNRLNHLQDRLLANDLRRGEFYHYPQADLPSLRRAIAENNLDMSVHCPLAQSDWYGYPPTWSFLCDVDEEKRGRTLKLVRQTMELAEEMGAEYVVVHYPSPRSPEAAREGYERERRAALESCQELAELSLKHGLPIHLEGFGPSPFLNPQFLGELFRTYPHLRYCFDTGHLHYMAHQGGFDYYQFAAAMAPYLGSVHLWTNRTFEDYQNYHHIPVHPSQRPQEGWVDVARVLGLLVAGRRDIPVIFESAHRYPPALGDYDVREGVRWVKEILATLS